MLPVTRRGALLAIGAAPLLSAPAVLAQGAWPNRPIRLVVAFPAGSVTDTLMRHLSEPLSRELGQPVIVDNRPGGNGVVGTESAARSAPDGHTWVVLSTTNGALNTYTVRRLTYDPVKDFTPIGMVAENGYILVVKADHPAKDLRGLIDLARQRPGQLTYSIGNSSSHIASATLARMAGVEMLAVPYRGGPEALTDVMAGRIDSTFTDLPAGLPQIRDGRIRALGITLSQSISLAPDIPPVGAVLPGYEFNFWFGMFMPTGTPDPIVNRANEAMNKVLRSPAMREKLAPLGYEPTPTTPAYAREHLPRLIAHLTDAARAAGLEQQ